MSNQGSIGFQIEGAFITDLARDMWCFEGIDGAQRAIKLLDSVEGMSTHHKIDLLEGRARLEGVNSLELVADDALEHKGEPIPSFADLLDKAKHKIVEEQERAMDACAFANGDLVNVASPWGLIAVPWHVTRPARKAGTGGRALAISFEECEARFPGAVEKAKEDADARSVALRRSRSKNPGDLLTVLSKTTAESVEAERGTYKDRNGWLLPNGVFYKCSYFEHDSLLTVLGKDRKDIEHLWIHVQHPKDSIVKVRNHSFGNLGALRRITKKQIDFIFDYCRHHGQEYPIVEIEYIGT